MFDELNRKYETHSVMHSYRDYKSDKAHRLLDGCFYPMESPLDFHWVLRALADKEAAFGQYGLQVQNSQVSGQHPFWPEKMPKDKL